MSSLENFNIKRKNEPDLEEYLEKEDMDLETLEFNKKLANSEEFKGEYDVIETY
jgi:hypothetical protein